MDNAQRIREKLILINSLLRAMPRSEFYADRKYATPKEMVRALDVRAEAILDAVLPPLFVRETDSPLMDAVEDHLGEANHG